MPEKRERAARAEQANRWREAIARRIARPSAGAEPSELPPESPREYTDRKLNEARHGGHPAPLLSAKAAAVGAPDSAGREAAETNATAAPAAHAGDAPIAESVLLAPSGRRYRIVHSSERDSYDPADTPERPAG